MIVRDTDIDGLKIIDIEPIRDKRGFFARSFCKDEFLKNNLQHEIVQCNISHNIHKGTLRGMHYQLPPYEEVKIVRCTQGAIFDVVIDLRIESATYLKWRGFDLRANDYRMIYIPKGCAHGFQTLKDNSDVEYMVTEVYHPDYYQGVQWNDNVFGIQWPIVPPIISDKDQNYPDYHA
jgi:dTDP-4-dehydrorhamnose 3,5-epimerase